MCGCVRVMRARAAPAWSRKTLGRRAGRRHGGYEPRRSPAEDHRSHAHALGRKRAAMARAHARAHATGALSCARVNRGVLGGAVAVAPPLTRNTPKTNGNRCVLLWCRPSSSGDHRTRGMYSVRDDERSRGSPCAKVVAGCTWRRGRAGQAPLKGRHCSAPRASGVYTVPTVARHPSVLRTAGPRQDKDHTGPSCTGDGAASRFV